MRRGANASMPKIVRRCGVKDEESVGTRKTFNLLAHFWLRILAKSYMQRSLDSEAGDLMKLQMYRYQIAK